MTILQSKGGLFVRKAKLLCFGPDRNDIGCSHTGFDQADSMVKVVAAPLIRIDLGLGCATDHKCPVVAGAIPHITVQDVEIGWIARSENTIRKHMGMWAASFA